MEMPMLVEADIASWHDGFSGGIVDEHGIAIFGISDVVSNIRWVFEVALACCLRNDDCVRDTAEHEELVWLFGVAPKRVVWSGSLL